jgi:membrane protease YdiL (CAAX protease family)
MANKKKTIKKTSAASRGRLGQVFEQIVEKARKQSKKSKAWRIVILGLYGLGLALWVGLVLYAIEFAVAYVMVKMLPAESWSSALTSSVFQVIVYAITLVVSIMVPWWALRKKTTRDELGLRGAPTWTDLLLAPIGLIVALLAAGALTALMMAIMPGIDWQQTQTVGYNRSMMYHAGNFILAFSCLVVLAPVCEEIIFRGWLYGKLRFRMPAIPAILITSVLFGVMHGQWNVGVTVFAMSVVMCVLRELTGTIWSGVILHMLKNGVAFYFLFAA